MSSFISTRIRYSFVLIVGVLLVSSCSNSNNSSTADGAQLPAGSVAVDMDPENPTTDTGTPETENDPTTDGDTTPSVPDPLAENSVRVAFSITVPAYQSNALQVRLAWGDKAFNASWVGDELWSANNDFPTNTEHELFVTFSDANGSIALGQYKQVFKTGTNDSESYQISASQFNTEQLDSDNDGISNLAESIASTDPLINESSQLDVSDSVILPRDIMSISQQLETRLSKERPHLESHNDFIPFSSDTNSYGTSIETNIAIDIEGNGSISDSSWAPIDTKNHSGVRTHAGNSILWVGEYSTYDGDYGRTRDFSNKVTFVDENTREFTEVISEVYSGTYRDTWEISSTVTGELIAGTSLCKPVSGTISREHGTNRDGPFITTKTTVSKGAGDQFWTVVEVNGEGATTEYFVRELELQTDDTGAQNFPAFLCDFVDF